MSNFKDLMDGLGLVPQNLKAGPGRVSEFAASNPWAADEQRRKALSKLAAQTRTPGAPVFQSETGGLGRLGQYNGVGSAVMPDPDEGFQWSDIGDGLKDGLFKALDVIDTPRAFVASVLKEGQDAFWSTDAGRYLIDLGKDKDMTDEKYKAELVKMNADGGWQNDDLAQQTWDNEGVGDWAEDYDTDKDTPMWLKRGVGFAGDIATDPTLRVAMSGKTVARGVGLADNAIVQAVNEGGRTAISKTILEKAATEGLQAEALDLVKSAAQRGRGALTPTALAKAGVDEALAKRLGLPSLSRTFLGKEIVGSPQLAHVVEGAKGSLKQAVGASRGAHFMRMLRVAQTDGENGLMDIARSKTSSAADVAAATHALAANTYAKGKVGTWAAAKFHVAERDLKEGLQNRPQQELIGVTHAIEDGMFDVADIAGKVDNFLGTTGDDLIGFGVEFTKRENYVPHLLTRDARRSENKSLREWATSLSGKKFFENHRTLVKGSTFLGETLTEGSIREINTISQKRLGFKVLEDDITTILDVYLVQAKEAARFAAIREDLLKRGVAKDANVMRSLSEEQQKQLLEAQKLADAEWGKQNVALTDGTQVRFDQARQVLKEVRSRRSKVLGELDKLRVNIAKVQRDRGAWEARIASLRGDLPSLERALETARSDAKRARGTAQRAAGKRVEVLERALGVRRTELAALEARIAKMPRGGLVARVGKAEYKNVEQNIDQLTKDLAGFSEDQARLHQAVQPLGQAGVPGEEPFRAVQEPIAQMSDQIDKDGAKVLEADFAKLALEDKAQVLETLSTKLDDAIDLASKKGFKRGAGDAAAVKTHVNQVRAALERVSSQTDPKVRAMLDLEAKAATYDIQAALHGQKAASFESMIKTMQDPKFGDIIRYEADFGNALWNRMQVPEWVDELYTVQHQLKDPNFFSEAARFYMAAQNVWKAWAVGRPGFLLRNAYSSMFNVYLEAGHGAAASMRTFKKFYNIFEANPETYLDEALKVFHDETLVKKLDDALGAIYATGGGRSVNEVVDNVFKSGTWNPASAQFKPLRKVRDWNGQIEATVRGGHAFDVIQRGGTADMAASVVKKWHFDYSAGTDFDRKARMAMPFWGFMSNNIALQTHVLTHDLGRLNRSYMNLSRNMSLGEPDDVNTPDWLNQSTPLPLNVNPDGNSTYLLPGLATFDFLRDVQNIGEPAKLISNLSPPVGLAIEGVAERNLFTDRPLTGMRDAGIWGLIPGLGETTGSGGQAITPYQYDILNGLLPGGANANRLSGGTGQPFSQALLGWLGVSYTQVTPKQREGVAYGRQQELKAQAAKRKLLAEM